MFGFFLISARCESMRKVVHHAQDAAGIYRRHSGCVFVTTEACRVSWAWELNMLGIDWKLNWMTWLHFLREARCELRSNWTVAADESRYVGCLCPWCCKMFSRSISDRGECHAGEIPSQDLRVVRRRIRFSRFAMTATCGLAKRVVRDIEKNKQKTFNEIFVCAVTEQTENGRKWLTTVCASVIFASLNYVKRLGRREEQETRFPASSINVFDWRLSRMKKLDNL